MKTNRGVSSVFIYIVISIFILAGIVSYFLFFYEKAEEKVPIAQSVNEALITDERAKGVKPSNVVIDKHVGQFVRGTLTDLNDSKTKTFYVIKIGDIWRVVDVVEDSVSCERFTRIGFPADFIPDCQLSFPDAVTVAEIDATLDKIFLEEVPLQVIGMVTEITINEGGETVTIVLASGGENTTIQSDIDDVNDIDSGDIVVITAEVIEEPNQENNDDSAQQSGGGQTITVSNIIEIGGDDDEVIDPENTPILPQETENDGNDTEDEDSQSISGGGTGATILKINAPVAAPPTEQFFNVYDLDNSFEDVKIEGSF